MSYSNVRFIGYKIFTAPKNMKWDRDPDEDGARVNEGTYIGPASADQDLRTRCQLMKKAVLAAMEHIGTDDDETLKVFVAPEFFFRTSAGAYPMGIANKGIDKLKRALLRMVRARKWRHWLFVFGTALGYRYRSNKGFYNVALVVRGGAGLEGDLCFSRLLQTNRLKPLPLDNDAAIADAAQRVPQKYHDTRGLIEVDGIAFGLELGLDHEARHEREGPAEPLPGGKLPQIILAPSCGPRAPARLPPENGFLFCSDGWKPGCFLFTRSASDDSEAEQVKGLEKTADLDVADVAAETVFSGKPGKVMIYKPRAIPAARLAPGAYRDMTYATQDGSYNFALKCLYNEFGSLRETLCRITNKRTGATTPNYYLPLAVTLEDEQAPLRARLDARYAPWNEEGNDMVIFADLTYRDSAFKGAVLPFSGRIHASANEET